MVALVVQRMLRTWACYDCHAVSLFDQEISCYSRTVQRPHSGAVVFLNKKGLQNIQLAGKLQQLQRSTVLKPHLV
jgi:hypothetical protein